MALMLGFSFSSILSLGSRIPRIRKRRNYVTSQMNFGMLTLLLRKIRLTNEMKQMSRAMGFEHGAILSVD